MKLTSFRNLALAAFAALALSTSAHALSLTIADADFMGNDNSNLNAAELTAIIGGSALTEFYKSDGGGTLSTSYETDFSTGNEDAWVDYVPGETAVSAGEIYLYVKDGNNEPAYYIFDISGWDGTEQIAVLGLWPNQGSISHLTILGRGEVSVPDGGATAVLLGLGLVALSFFARRRAA